MANPLRAFWRDAKFGVRLLRVLRLFGDLKPDDARTIADDFEDVIDAQPDKVAFVFECESVTYRQFEERANRVANWAVSQGLLFHFCCVIEFLQLSGNFPYTENCIELT